MNRMELIQNAQPPIDDPLLSATELEDMSFMICCDPSVNGCCVHRGTCSEMYFTLE